MYWSGILASLSGIYWRQLAVFQTAVPELFQALQVSLSKLNMKVHHSTIRVKTEQIYQEKKWALENCIWTNNKTGSVFYVWPNLVSCLLKPKPRVSAEIEHLMPTWFYTYMCRCRYRYVGMYVCMCIYKLLWHTHIKCIYLFIFPAKGPGYFAVSQPWSLLYIVNSWDMWGHLSNS